MSMQAQTEVLGFWRAGRTRGALIVPYSRAVRKT